MNTSNTLQLMDGYHVANEFSYAEVHNDISTLHYWSHLVADDPISTLGTDLPYAIDCTITLEQCIDINHCHLEAEVYFYYL